MKKQSSSHFLAINSLQYHVRTWGDNQAPAIYLLHGWMDVSASFQFVVDSLVKNWFVIAPDWRGFGLTEWATSGYWFPEYVSDLERIVSHFTQDIPVHIVGHSMGGNIAGLYTGLFPQRVKRLILAEGFGMPPTDAKQAPGRMKKWIDQRNDPPKLRPYGSEEEVAARLKTNTPGLSNERADFLVQHWAKKISNSEYELRADPKHKMINPILYRHEEAFNFWSEITCPTLWVHSDSDWLTKFMKDDITTIAKYRSSFKNLSETKISGSTHMMHHDSPEKFATIIESFFTTET